MRRNRRVYFTLFIYVNAGIDWQRHVPLRCYVGVRRCNASVSEVWALEDISTDTPQGGVEGKRV